MGIASVTFCIKRASGSAVEFWKRAVSARVGDVPESRVWKVILHHGNWEIDFTFDMGHYFFSHFDLLSRNCPGDIFVVEVF